VPSSAFDGPITRLNKLQPIEGALPSPGGGWSPEKTDEDELNRHLHCRTRLKTQEAIEKANMTRGLAQRGPEYRSQYWACTAWSSYPFSPEKDFDLNKPLEERWQRGSCANWHAKFRARKEVYYWRAKSYTRENYLIDASNAKLRVSESIGWTLFLPLFLEYFTALIQGGRYCV
jgi:hypothetical protein